MRFSTSTIVALLFSSLAAADPAAAEPASAKALSAHITARYSTANGCKSAQYIKVGTTHDAGKCVNLKVKAKSFGVGSPSDKTQLPNGCTLRGFQKLNCKGIEEDSLSGPTKYSTCEDVFGGTIQSFDVDCAGS